MTLAELVSFQVMQTTHFRIPLEVAFLTCGFLSPIPNCFIRFYLGLRPLILFENNNSEAFSIIRHYFLFLLGVQIGNDIKQGLIIYKSNQPLVQLTNFFFFYLFNGLGKNLQVKHEIRISGSINKVVSEHSHIHLFNCCFCTPFTE